MDQIRARGGERTTRKVPKKAVLQPVTRAARPKMSLREALQEQIRARGGERTTRKVPKKAVLQPVTRAARPKMSLREALQEQIRTRGERKKKKKLTSRRESLMAQIRSQRRSSASSSDNDRDGGGTPSRQMPDEKVVTALKSADLACLAPHFGALDLLVVHDLSTLAPSDVNDLIVELAETCKCELNSGEQDRLRKLLDKMARVGIGTQMRLHVSPREPVVSARRSKGKRRRGIAVRRSGARSRRSTSA